MNASRVNELLMLNIVAIKVIICPGKVISRNISPQSMWNHTFNNHIYHRPFHVLHPPINQPSNISKHLPPQTNSNPLAMLATIQTCCAIRGKFQKFSDIFCGQFATVGIQYFCEETKEENDQKQRRKPLLFIVLAIAPLSNCHYIISVK